MPSSPTPSPENPRVLLRCGGTAIANTAQIVSVDVGRSFNRIPYAIVELADRDGVLRDDGSIAPGTPVVIEIVPATSSESTVLFEGVLLRLKFCAGTGLERRLRLECLDRAVAMSAHRKSTTYRGKTDSEIIASLAAVAGLQVEVAPTSVRRKTLARRDCTDWAFAVARAEANGLSVIADAGRLVAKVPDVAGPVAFSLVSGVDDFALELDLAGGAAKLPSAAGLRGHVRLPGSARAALGSVVELKGLGPRFSGNVLISSIRHEVTLAGWTTEFGFGMPRDESSAANEIAALVAAQSAVAESRKWCHSGGEVRRIVLSTPGGGTIAISDDAKSIRIQDQNGNKVALAEDGISLESTKDITLKAAGAVRIDAAGAVRVRADQDFAVAGLNVNLAAKVGLAATGAATAELSASGQTTIKGAMVMIN